MYTLKVFLFSICFMTACGNSVSQTESIIQNRESKGGKLSLIMERTGCYGICPIYSLVVESNGKVLFDGKGYTKTIGKAENSLTQEKISLLIDEIEKSDFFSLKDSYTNVSDNCPNYLTDAATVTLTIQLNDKSKTIKHYLGCHSNEDPLNKELSNNSSSISIKDHKDFSKRIFPQQLYILETKIDEIADTKRWIGERK